jgi:hypothetical protein
VPAASNITNEHSDVSDTTSAGTWQYYGPAVELTYDMILGLQSGGLSYDFSWKDQGGENQKGKMYLALYRGGSYVKWHYVNGGNAAPHSWTDVDETIPGTHDMFAYAQAGDELKWKYLVGSGGGHKLYIEDFSYTMNLATGVATTSNDHTCQACAVGYDGGGTTGSCAQEIYLTSGGEPGNLWYGPSVAVANNPTDSSEYFKVDSGGDSTGKSWYGTGYDLLTINVIDTTTGSETTLKIRATKEYSDGSSRKFTHGSVSGEWNSSSFRPKFEIRAIDNGHLTEGHSYRSIYYNPLVISPRRWHIPNQDDVISDPRYPLRLIVNYSYRGLRLDGGTGTSNGRLEAYSGGAWKQVCDDSFGSNAADVACRQLGFGGGAPAYGSLSDANWPGYGTDVLSGFALDDCACNGSEKTLQDCCPAYTGGCSASEAVWVECTESKQVNVGSGTAGEQKWLYGNGADSNGDVDNTFVCPTVVNKDNGIKIDGGVPLGSWPDTFNVDQSSYWVGVTRTDNGNGWSWDLAFKCYRAGYRE